ncbi:MAG TPA: FHA domain-containing protein [Chthonomonadales bacterium]|nr:FHA domain-containing protein [Chthonomonadales bacterium]
MKGRKDVLFRSGIRRVQKIGLFAVFVLLFMMVGASLAQTGTSSESTKPAGDKPAPLSAEAPKPTGHSAPSNRVLTITVPEDGEYYVRLLPSPDAAEPAQLPEYFIGKKTVIHFDPAKLGKSPRIAIDDARRGNSAIQPLPSGDTLDIHRLDFNHVRRVEAHVTYAGKPVRTALVKLTTPDKKTQTFTIDATKRGVAIFEDVPVGKAKLTTAYGNQLTETRDIDITTDHPGDKIIIPVAVSSEVATLEVEETVPTASSTSSGTTPSQAPPLPGAAGESTSPGGPPSSGGGLVGLLGNLIGLAVAGGLIYLLYRWAQSGGMAATLKKIGIEVSGPSSDAGMPWRPNAPAPPVVTDPSLCPFCGQKKDEAGNCACSLTPSATITPGLGSGTGAGVVPSQPRLVATMGVYSGSIFPLGMDGNGVTVGRDPTNTIFLGNDNTVSRRHASFRIDNGTYIVNDEGSSNGVYVNGVRISGPQPLRPGDEVQIGNTRFRFEI